MARAYSDDLRRKVLSAYGAGKGTMRELAQRFDVSYGWVLKIAAAQRQSGSYKRVPQRRAPSRIDAGLVRRLVEAQPDIVLVELQQKAAEQGVRVSTVHLWRILAKLGLRLKKSHSTPPSATPKRISSSAKFTSKPSPRSRRKT
jgi:putative transposase